MLLTIHLFSALQLCLLSACAVFQTGMYEPWSVYKNIKCSYVGERDDFVGKGTFS